MKLHFYEMMIPGDFGLEFNVPIWQDHLSTFDSSEILKFSLDYIKKDLDLKDLHKDRNQTIWNQYNLFACDHKIFKDLREQIKQSYNAFTKNYQVEQKKNLYINGWFSILRKGSYVEKHCHSTHQNSYLTGVFVISKTEESTTDFYLPQFEHLDDVGVVKIKNHKNDLIMFPQWLFHSVSPIVEDVRITLAFDLFTEEAVDYYKNNNTNEDFPIKRAIPL